jgi:hypothetical protein
VRLSSRYVRPGLSRLSARLASCSLDVLVDPSQGILSAALSHRFEGHTYGESRPPIIFNLALSPTLRGPLRLAWCQKAPGAVTVHTLSSAGGDCALAKSGISSRNLAHASVGQVEYAGQVILVDSRYTLLEPGLNKNVPVRNAAFGGVPDVLARRQLRELQCKCTA